MSTDFILNAQSRADMGKGASRRLRHAGKVPGIMYGIGKEPTPIQLEHNELAHQLENEAFFSHILTIKLDGKEESAIIKDLQRHPARPLILHADFQRVSATAMQNNKEGSLYYADIELVFYGDKAPSRRESE